MSPWRTIHPTVQVGTHHAGGKYTVGPLGLINGFFGIAPDGYGAIAAVFEVNCPNGHKVMREVVGEKCKTCGTELVLGHLLRFEQIRKARRTDA